MSTGLPVFDTTIQETNRWLQMVEAELPPCSRQQAYGALRAVLHELRDRLPEQSVAGLSAQLPMLVRGFALEGWNPSTAPTDIRDPQAFAAAVAERLPPGFPREPTAVVTAVFAVLAARLDPGEVGKVIHQLPLSLRALWPPHLQVA